VLKEIRGTDLITALRRAAAGQSLFSAEARAKVLNRMSPERKEDPRMALLSPQERRVLELIGQGLTNREIGAQLFLAEKTVKNYVSSLLAKLGYERRTQAALFIARNHPAAQ
jgi:DNA-binding NarL/FixJ family response regulator